MTMRKITSMTALISFVLELFTSIVLYIVPHGRVAYWADWRFLGLSKTEWSDQHVNLGVLLMVAILLHAYLNWTPMINYMKNSAKQLVLFTKDFNVGLALTLLFCIGTYLSVPPFSSIIEFSSSIKDDATKVYGEPPYGHAELSTLEVFTKKLKLDLKASIEKLKGEGLQGVEANQTLLVIAKANKMSPQTVYQIIKNQKIKAKESTTTLPDFPPAGFGNLPLAEACAEYKLNCEQIIETFKEAGLAASTDMSIKGIGNQYGRNPHDLYDMIKK